MRRWLVPGVPFLFSLGLSAATVSSELFWQDSGFFLSAIRDLAVLYPHGFVAYELLCKGWTLLFSFLDFTLAVHLFSSFCAAVAAGVIGLTGRDLVRARSPLLRVTQEDPGDLADWAGSIAGCLAAGGYTFWMAGIYAKGYSFFYMILALLLWAMIRAAERRTPRDLTWVALLIGSAWQAHPSAVGAGLCFLCFVAFHHHCVGWTGLLWRFGLAALCAMGPAFFLPLLARHDSIVSFGEPSTARELWKYLVGKRFIESEEAFGLSYDRWISASVFFWEEFLGVGLLLVATGLAWIARVNRKLLSGLLLWILPYMGLTLGFVMEGQHDHWYVAAWLPLYLTAAVGLYRVGRAAGPRARLALITLGTLGGIWSGVANFSDLNQRGNNLPELLGTIYLKPLPASAILITTSDDGTGATHFLQVVRGIRRDVTLVRPGHLNSGEGGNPGWYDRALMRRNPLLTFPPYAELRRRFPKRPKLETDIAAFINEVVTPERPVYVEEPPQADLIRPDYTLVPAGVMMKVVPRGREQISLADWRFPITAEEVRARFRRGRGISSEQTSSGRRRDQEPYERRLFLAILRSRLYLADWYSRHGDLRQARDLYESILRTDPHTARVVDVIHPLGVCNYLLGEHARARPFLEQVLALSPSDSDLSEALYYLGEISLASGKRTEALNYFRAAVAIPTLPASLREKINAHLTPR